MLGVLAFPAAGLPGADGGVVAPLAGNDATDEEDDEAAPLALQSSVQSSSAAPGDVVTIDYTLRNTGNEQVYAPSVAVGTLPEGWVVAEQYEDGGTYHEARRFWTWGALNPGQTVEPSLRVRVPDDTDPGRYDVCAVTDEPDDRTDAAVATVEVTGTTRGSGSAVRHCPEIGVGADRNDPEVPLELRSSARPSRADPGDVVAINYTLRNGGEGPIYGPLVDTGTLPDDWTVVGQHNASGTYNDRLRAWIWMALDPGRAIEPSLRVRVPVDAEPGWYDVCAVADDPENRTDAAVATVEVTGTDGGDDSVVRHCPAVERGPDEGTGGETAITIPDEGDCAGRAVGAPDDSPGLFSTASVVEELLPSVPGSASTVGTDGGTTPAPCASAL